MSKPNKQKLPHRFWLVDVVFPRRFVSTFIVFSFILLLSSASAASLHRFSRELRKGRKEPDRSSLPGRVVDQKRLGGPGSTPPICRSRMKCGKCKPCKAVKVPIKPGLIMSLEYYPEAWRCMCGNKIFMP